LKIPEKFKRYFDGLWSLEKILVKLIIVGLIVPALLALRFEMMQIDNKNLANDENGRLDLATDARFRRAMAEIKKDSSTLEADRLELVANQMASEKEYIEEMQGGTGSPGYGPRAKQLGELRNSKTQQLIDYDAKMKILMDNLIARREQLISQHDEELTRNKMMADSGAIFGGEHSGHFYFKEFWRADSGALAALHAIAALGESDTTMSALLAPYNRYVISGEINSKVSDTKAATEAVEKSYASDQVTMDHLDGLTVNGDTWWFNLRPSNTEPLLRLNVEASTQAQMETVRDAVLSLIRG